MVNVMETGRHCIVKAGRRSGEQVKITSVLNKNFVRASDKKGKERKYSVMHLEPLKQV